MYANLTADQKAAIRQQFTAAIQMKADTAQAVSIAASQGLRMTDRQWNGKAGSNAFAAALATLVMAGDVTLRHRRLVPPGWERIDRERQAAAAAIPAAVEPCLGKYTDH